MGKRTTILLVLLICCGTFIVDFNNKQITESTVNYTFNHEINSDAITANLTWTKDVHIERGAPHYADLNGDGYLDIVFASGFDLYCLSGKNGEQLWKTSESSNFIFTPSIFDVDNDSRLEVIILGDEFSGSDTIYCYDHEGNDEWTLKVPSSYGDYPFHTSVPCIGDINFDGYFEIIIGTRFGIICYDTEDFSRWDYTIDSEVYCSPTLMNADSDANYEIVFTCSDGYIYCIDDDGDLIWKTALVGTTISAVSSPVVYDRDNDGKHEIFVGTGTKFCNYASNGSLLWSYNSQDEINTFQGTPAIVNIENWGPTEILVQSDYNTLYCFSEQGVLNWTYVGVGSHTEFSSVVLANIDGDDWQEIILVGDELACLSKDGIEIFSHPLEYWSFTNPLVGDFDADGMHEIFYADYMDTVNCLDISLNEPYYNSSVKSGGSAWPCFKGSNYHTGFGDYDGDMMDESTEKYYSTNSTKSDTDSDGFLDGWEVMVGLNPLIDDAFDDLDGDNLTNYIEAKTYHTSVFNPDTDGDGMNDGDEIAIGRDPLVDENDITSSIPTNFTLIFPVENIYTILFAAIALIVIVKRKRNK